MEQTIGQGAHRFHCKVYYEDTDLAGIVYYANYLRFIERARSEALAEGGVDQVAMLDGTGVVFAVRRVEADYFAPARFQDRLCVTTSLLALGGSSVDLEQIVWRDETRLFRAAVRLVCINASGRATRVPESARRVLAQFGPAE